MVEKGIRRRICPSIYRYTNANNKYMKDYDEHKNSYIFSIGIKIIYMVGQCLKSFQ